MVVGRVTDIQFNTETFDAAGYHEYRQPLPIPKGYFRQYPNVRSFQASSTSGLPAGGDETVLKNGDKIMKTNSALVLEEMIGRFLFNKASEGDGKEKAGAD